MLTVKDIQEIARKVAREEIEADHQRNAEYLDRAYAETYAKEAQREKEYEAKHAAGKN
jgi:hypothetical protein